MRAAFDTSAPGESLALHGLSDAETDCTALRSAARGRECLLALSRNTRKTECGANLFVIRLKVRAAPFALFRNTRKTECGARLFLTPLAVRATPFALRREPVSTQAVKAANPVAANPGKLPLGVV